MFRLVPTDSDIVLRVDCDGKLSTQDIAGIHAALHRHLEAEGRTSLVIGLANFEGYESGTALKKDFQMDVKHRNDFWRVALIGDQSWGEWGATLGDLFSSAELRWFDADHASHAVAWAASQD
ncbi:MAG: STAS/SEC14 domain-containing protein [Devosia marina]|uniref:STAS/SEC14 domain-containing protein n=1 Tax=Devosia marina TaxID=2683198 RepID=UPI0032EB2E48